MLDAGLRTLFQIIDPAPTFHSKEIVRRRSIRFVRIRTELDQQIDGFLDGWCHPSMARYKSASAWRTRRSVE